MTAYFVPANVACAEMLDPSTRDAPNLELRAKQAERDVIRFYTKALADVPGLRFGTVRPTGTRFPPYEAVGETLGVFLEHYKTDAAEVDLDDEAAVEFVAAFRQTVAALIEWRLMQERLTLIATQESGRKGTLVKSMLQIEPYPPNWTRWLMPYQTLAPLTVI